MHLSLSAPGLVKEITYLIPYFWNLYLGANKKNQPSLAYGGFPILIYLLMWFHSFLGCTFSFLTLKILYYFMNQGSLFIIRQ